MIIDIKGLIKHVLESRVKKGEAALEMVFKDGYFTPQYEKDPLKVNIPANYKGGEFVGFAIVEKAPTAVNNAVLTSNGLLVSINKAKAGDVLLLDKYEDAVNAINNFTKYASSFKPIYPLMICSCYQENRSDNIIYKGL